MQQYEGISKSLYGVKEAIQKKEKKKVHLYDYFYVKL